MERINLQSTFSKIMDYEQFNACERKDVQPIAIICINDKIVIEYINETDMLAYIEEQKTKSQIEQPKVETTKSKELIEAENTILNTDPFGDHIHAGKTLIDIVESDMEWVKLALEKMTNKYIRDRLELIVKSRS